MLKFSVMGQQVPFGTERRGGKMGKVQPCNKNCIELLNLPKIVTQFDCFMRAIKGFCREILIGRNFRFKQSQFLLPTVDLPA